jgi:hypothetical protein
VDPPDKEFVDLGEQLGGITWEPCVLSRWLTGFQVGGADLVTRNQGYVLDNGRGFDGHRLGDITAVGDPCVQATWAKEAGECHTGSIWRHRV